MKRDQAKYNLYTLIIFSILGFIMVTFGEGGQNAGIGYNALIWMPFAIATVTYGLYHFSRKFTVKNNWIITLFGILLILSLGISVVFDL